MPVQLVRSSENRQGHGSQTAFGFDDNCASRPRSMASGTEPGFQPVSAHSRNDRPCRLLRSRIVIISEPNWRYQPFTARNKFSTARPRTIALSW